MFDIIPSHENELALAIDIEGVHNPKARLARASARRLDAAREQGAHDQQQHQ